MPVITIQKTGFNPKHCGRNNVVILYLQNRKTLQNLKCHCKCTSNVYFNNRTDNYVHSRKSSRDTNAVGKEVKNIINVGKDR